MQVSPKLYNLIIHPPFVTKWYIEKNIKSILNFDNKKILDFGCGTGNNSFIFDPKFYTGIDIDADRILYAKKLYPDYNFLSSDVDLHNIPSQSQDIILISAVLHHITTYHIKEYMSEFDRILKNDGIIIVFEPFLDPTTPIRSLFMKFFDEGDFIRSEEDYYNLFSDFFKIETYKKFNIINGYRMLFFSARK